MLCFTYFLNLRVTPPCKGDKEKGASNIVNFHYNNNHNISPMIILMLPVFSTSSNTFKSLNSSSSSEPHHLCHRNWVTVAVFPPPQPQQPLPKSHMIASAAVWSLFLKNMFFIAKIIILANSQYLGISSMH